MLGHDIATMTDVVTEFTTYEVALHSAAPPVSPFEVNCVADVNSPVESRHADMRVALFYAGDAAWNLRFTPDTPGTYTWRVDCPEAAIAAVGSVLSEASSSSALGAVESHPLHPRFLRREAGDPFVPVGMEMDALILLGVTEGMGAVQRTLAGLQLAGVNYVPMQLFYNYSSWTTQPAFLPPRVAPTRLTPWASADQLTLDLDYFDVVDRVLRELERRSMVAHLMLYVGNKHVNWPEPGGAADDVYWRYCMARFGASNAVVLDVSKEAGSYGVGDEYIFDRLRLMSLMNAHGRLLGAHSGVSKASEYRSNACPPELCSLLPAQLHFWGNGSFETFEEQVPRFFGALLALTQAAENARRPLGSVEFLYEAGALCGCNDGTCCNGCAATAAQHAQMRSVMWQSYFAGSFGTWYSSDSAWDVVSAEASASVWTRQLATLGAFWRGVGPAWRFGVCSAEQAPSASGEATVRCLVDPERNTTIVHSLGTHAALTFAAAASPVDAASYWVDPTAVALEKLAFTAPAWPVVSPPDSIAEEAVLYLVWH